jgi:hypothetical protein
MTSTGGATVFAQTALLAPLRALLSALAFGPHLADQLRPGADPAHPAAWRKPALSGLPPAGYVIAGLRARYRGDAARCRLARRGSGDGHPPSYFVAIPHDARARTADNTLRPLRRRLRLPRILAVCLPTPPLSFSCPSASADSLRTGREAAMEPAAGASTLNSDEAAAAGSRLGTASGPVFDPQVPEANVPCHFSHLSGLLT